MKLFKDKAFILLILSGLLLLVLFLFNSYLFFFRYDDYLYQLQFAPIIGLIYVFYTIYKRFFKKKKFYNDRDDENVDVIYVELLNEGTKVYRPVFAAKIRKDVYKLKGFRFYNPNDEEWKFKPGSVVKVESKMLDDVMVKIAVEEIK